MAQTLNKRVYTLDFDKGDVNSTEKKSFEILFKKSYKGLYLHALSFVRDEENAKDIVNDVFEYLWNNYSKVDLSASETALLYTLVRNRSLDYLRHEKAVEKFRAYKLNNSDEGGENYREYEELIQRVMVLIDSMPAQTRAVFMKCFVERKKYKEAGDELNISVNTVKTHISKALRILREQFSDEEVMILIIIFKKSLKKVSQGITHF